MIAENYLQQQQHRYSDEIRATSAIHQVSQVSTKSQASHGEEVTQVIEKKRLSFSIESILA